MGIRTHPHFEQTAMAGLNAEPITAVSVVDNIKQVWYVAIVVIAGGSSLRSFGGTLTLVLQVPPNAEEAENIEDTSDSVYYRARSGDRP